MSSSTTNNNVVIYMANNVKAAGQTKSFRLTFPLPPPAIESLRRDGYSSETAKQIERAALGAVLDIGVDWK